MISPPAKHAPIGVIASGVMKKAASASSSATFPEPAVIQRPALLSAALRALSTVRVDDDELIALWIILMVGFKVILIIAIAVPVGLCVCICLCVLVFVLVGGKAVMSSQSGTTTAYVPGSPLTSPYAPTASPYAPAASPNPYVPGTTGGVYTADGGAAYAAAGTPPPNYSDAGQYENV